CRLGSHWRAWTIYGLRLGSRCQRLGRLHMLIRLSWALDARCCVLLVNLLVATACTSAVRPATEAARAAASTTARLPVPGAPAGVTAFVDVSVIPMDTERLLPSQTVLV